MEKEFRKRKSSLEQGKKQDDLYAAAIAARPANADPEAARALSLQLKRIATALKLSVAELLEKAEHSTEFREEYLEARKLACQIALLRK